MDEALIGMTQKDMLLELYKDMKFVRPAVEALMNNNIVHRVEELEQYRTAREAANKERSRLGDVTNKGIVLTVLLTNFIVGLAVIIANVFLR
jgi:hypothetical protein